MELVCVSDILLVMQWLYSTSRSFEFATGLGRLMGRERLYSHMGLRGIGRSGREVWRGLGFGLEGCIGWDEEEEKKEINE